jgi:hypothetical protein
VGVEDYGDEVYRVKVVEGPIEIMTSLKPQNLSAIPSRSGFDERGHLIARTFGGPVTGGSDRATRRPPVVARGRIEGGRA